MMNYHWDHSIQPENWAIDIPKDSILVSGYLNLNTLTQLTGFSLDTLKRLNPHILSHFLPKNAQQVKVHIPRSRFPYFLKNRAQILDSARVDLTAPDMLEIDTSLTVEEPSPVARRYTYKVKSGETLTRVARKLGLSISELKRINRIKGSKLRKGQTLVYFKLAKVKSSVKRKKPSSTRKKVSKKKKTKSKKRRKRR
jgi:membrane-bound lytic murein transglycosylase D